MTQLRRLICWYLIAGSLLAMPGCGKLKYRDILDTLSGARSATLSWNASTKNADGTPISDLAGYRIRYGTSAGVYTTTIDAGNVRTYTVSGLEPGKYYFVVQAYDSNGNVSVNSLEVTKTIE